MNSYQLDNSDLLKITKRLQRDFGVKKISLTEDYERNLPLVLEQAVSSARIGFTEYVIYNGSKACPKRFMSRIKNLDNILDSLIDEITMYRSIHGKLPLWYFNPVEFLGWVLIYRNIINGISIHLPDVILNGLIKMMSSLVYLKNAKEAIYNNSHLSLAMMNGLINYIKFNEFTLDDDILTKINSLNNRVNELLNS